MTPPRADAGLFPRFVAALIDNVICLIALSVAFSWVTDETVDENFELVTILTLVMFSAWFNYFAFCEWRWGKTLGKHVMSLSVVRAADGAKIDFGQASIRNVLRPIDFLGIGWLMIIGGKRHQRLGDRAARTVVAGPSREQLVTGAASSTPPLAISAGRAAAAALPGAAGGPAGLIPETSPRVSWSTAQTWGGLALGFFLAFFVAPALVLPFDPGIDTDAGLLAAQALLPATLVAVALAVATSWDTSRVRQALRELGLRRFRPSALGIVLAALIAYYIAAGLFASLVLQPEQDDIAGELGVNDSNLLVALTAIGLIALAAPIAEEIFFRGLIFGGLRGRFGPWGAAVISGLIFGSVHVFTGVTAAIPLAVLGMVLAWVYEKTGSLWPCVIMHMANNALALALLA